MGTTSLRHTQAFGACLHPIFQSPSRWGRLRCNFTVSEVVNFSPLRDGDTSLHSCAMTGRYFSPLRDGATSLHRSRTRERTFQISVPFAMGTTSLRHASAAVRSTYFSPLRDGDDFVAIGRAQCGHGTSVLFQSPSRWGRTSSAELELIQDLAIDRFQSPSRWGRLRCCTEPTRPPASEHHGISVPFAMGTTSLPDLTAVSCRHSAFQSPSRWGRTSLHQCEAHGYVRDLYISVPFAMGTTSLLYDFGTQRQSLAVDFSPLREGDDFVALHRRQHRSMRHSFQSPSRRGRLRCNTVSSSHVPAPVISVPFAKGTTSSTSRSRSPIGRSLFQSPSRWG